VRIIDFHSHLIPGVDDGAQDREQSLQGLLAMKAEGVEVVVATPHVDASLTARSHRLAERLDRIDGAWETFAEAASEAGLAVARGAEVALDTPEPCLDDPRLRLAGTRFALVEFAYMNVPPNAVRVLGRIRDDGWVPVVSHPERYGGTGSVEEPGSWREAGAYLQVNAGSLLGRYGPGPRRVAEELLARGWADYLSSDFHGRGRPWVRQAAEWLLERGGESQAELLMETNPRRLLDGSDPLPVPPLARPLWDRVRSAFR
jgi:protein-tyrosine phosphatase